MTKKTCLFEIEFPDSKTLDAAEKAVSHEGNVGKRAESTITKKGKTLAISITAKDVVALRATANAYLRALQVFEGMEKEGN